MATIVNLRRIERLEEKTGGTSFVARLSDAELDARLLTYATGETPANYHPVQDSGEVLPSDDEFYAMIVKDVNRIALSCSNRPDHFDGVLDELQGLGAPNAAAMLVEAVKAERLSRPYLWPDWRKALSERVLAMLDGELSLAQ